MTINPDTLIGKGSKIIGFGVMAHWDKFAEYLQTLFTQFDAGYLKITNDFGECTAGGRFVGLAGAIRGVEVIEIISNS